MDHRVALSPKLASLISQALASCRRLADDAVAPSGSAYRPLGAFKTDLEVINSASADESDVRSRVHSTGIHGADLARASAFDHVHAIENDVLREPVPIWSALTLS
jgi:hypothetical protein